MFDGPFAWHYYQHGLSVEAMDNAAKALVSRSPRDLSAFRKSGAAATHTDITVLDASVRRSTANPHIVHVDIKATWFVYGMMRLITATLVRVGAGLVSFEQFASVLDRGDRDAIKSSAPASGLCLMEVGYPDDLNPFRVHSG